jgi:hypothetical protein
VAIAWSSLLLAVFAGRHIKGPKGSYAGEVRKIMTGIRSRILRQEKRKRRERRLRRRRAQSKITRGSLPSTKQYNVGSNKNGDG